MSEKIKCNLCNGRGWRFVVWPLLTPPRKVVCCDCEGEGEISTGGDLFYIRPIHHSFTTRYRFTCLYCKKDSDSPNRRAISCNDPKCREKSRKDNAAKQAKKRWQRTLATRKKVVDI